MPDTAEDKHTFVISKTKPPVLKLGATKHDVKQWRKLTNQFLHLQDPAALFKAAHGRDKMEIRTVVATFYANIQDTDLSDIADLAVPKASDRNAVVPQVYDQDEDRGVTANEKMAGKLANDASVQAIEDDLPGFFTGVQKMLQAISDHLEPIDISSFVLAWRAFMDVGLRPGEEFAQLITRTRAAQKELERIRDELGIKKDKWMDLLNGLQYFKRAELTAEQIIDILPDDAAKFASITAEFIEKALRKLGTKQNLGKVMDAQNGQGNTVQMIQALALHTGADPNSILQACPPATINAMKPTKKKFDFTVGGGKGGNAWQNSGTRANGRPGAPKGVKIFGSALSAAEAYEAGSCMICGDSKHRIPRCTDPRATERVKDACLQEMRATLSKNKSKHTQRGKKINALEEQLVEDFKEAGIAAVTTLSASEDEGERPTANFEISMLEEMTEEMFEPNGEPQDVAAMTTSVNAAVMFIGPMLTSVCQATDPNVRRRSQMEDFLVSMPNLGDNLSYFAVFDGHGGAQVAEFLADSKQGLHQVLLAELDKVDTDKGGLPNMKTALTNAFLHMDDRLKEFEHVGSTASVCVLRREGENTVLYTANVGDSRVVVSDPTQEQPVAQRLSYDHKGSDEKEAERIKLIPGASVGYGRVCGILAVTRAFGDFALKDYGVIAEPDIDKRVVPDSSVVIMASDGLWDVVLDKHAAEHIQNLQTGVDAAQSLVKLAMDKKTVDNTAVLVLTVGAAPGEAAFAFVGIHSRKDFETVEHLRVPGSKDFFQGEEVYWIGHTQNKERLQLPANTSEDVLKLWKDTNYILFIPAPLDQTFAPPNGRRAFRNWIGVDSEGWGWTENVQAHQKQSDAILCHTDLVKDLSSVAELRSETNNNTVDVAIEINLGATVPGKKYFENQKKQTNIQKVLRLPEMERNDKIVFLQSNELTKLLAHAPIAEKKCKPVAPVPVIKHTVPSVGPNYFQKQRLISLLFHQIQKENQVGSLRSEDGPYFSFPGLQLRGWQAKEQGLRDMEDRIVAQMDLDEDVAFFAVFDGHGGDEVADYLAKHLHKVFFRILAVDKKDVAGALKIAFAQVDNDLKEFLMLHKLVHATYMDDKIQAKRDGQLVKKYLEDKGVASPAALANHIPSDSDLRKLKDLKKGTFDELQSICRALFSETNPTTLRSEFMTAWRSCPDQDLQVVFDKYRPLLIEYLISGRPAFTQEDDPDELKKKVTALGDAYKLLKTSIRATTGDPEVAKELSFVKLYCYRRAVLKNPDLTAAHADIKIFKKFGEIGSTASVCVVRWEDGERKLYVANLGDSRVVFSEPDQPPQALTKDHKPDDEIKRIKLAGGNVRDHRVQLGGGGKLSVARAFGDFAYKLSNNVDKYIVSSTPDVKKFSLPDNSVLVMASDGLWDMNESNKNATELARQDIAIGVNPAEDLVREAIRDAKHGQGHDNTAVFVLTFGEQAGKMASDGSNQNVLTEFRHRLEAGNRVLEKIAKRQIKWQKAALKREQQEEAGEFQDMDSEDEDEESDE